MGGTERNARSQKLSVWKKFQISQLHIWEKSEMFPFDDDLKNLRDYY